jgi:hypothetical protein
LGVFCSKWADFGRKVKKPSSVFVKKFIGFLANPGIITAREENSQGVLRGEGEGGSGWCGADGRVWMDGASGSGGNQHAG